jgi:hypothetical protein
MDAINSLVAAAGHAQTVVDGAAQQLAAAGLLTAPERDHKPAPAPPSELPRTHDVDVAGQLVTMALAADVHHVTTAALRSVSSLYRDSLDLLRPEPPKDPSGLGS